MRGTRANSPTLFGSVPHVNARAKMVRGESDASPQAISGRTSYGQARLEFLLYTQVIPACCTARGFGPPPDVTRGSPCSYVARLASGLIHATYFRLL